MQLNGYVQQADKLLSILQAEGHENFSIWAQGFISALVDFKLITEDEYDILLDKFK